MQRSRSLRFLFAPLFALALLASACGSDDDGAATGDGPAPDAPTAGIDLSGLTITVGSKDFDENILLGQMMVVALEAYGANVTDETDLGGTNVNRDALLNGSIDVYAEYNGTGWTEHLGNENPSSDPVELYEVVAAADLEENGIHWLGSSEFNNTYGFATGPDLTEANGGPFSFETMAEYLQENPDARVCMESEFPDRSDGLVLWENETGFQIPTEQQVILDTNIIYPETASGDCDFGEIFTTDGRIAGLDLTVVDDPGAMIIYNVSYTVRDEAFSQAGDDLTTISEAILEGLDQETMSDLNRQVSLEGDDPADVARSYLSAIGLI